MKLIKEINETIQLADMQSGFMKSPRSTENVRRVISGEDTVILDNGKEYKAGKRLRSDALKKGMVVLASYRSVNQGVDICKILGVTGDKKQYGEGGIKFDSVKECLKYYDVKNIRELEELQNQNEYGYESYLFVRDMEDVEDPKDRSGPWYYVFEGRWSRGSGAEKLSFVLLEEI